MRKKNWIYLTAILLVIPFFNSTSAEKIEDLPGDVEDIVSYWSFDEGEGQNSLNLVEGPDIKLGLNGQEGNEPQWTEGIKEQGLDFDGSLDVAIADDFDFPSTEFTLSFWIQTDSNDDGMVPISYATTYDPDEFRIQDPNDLKVRIRGISSTTGIDVSDGRWHHIVLTWNFVDGNLKVYKDMTEEFTGTLALGTEVRSGGTLVLGNDQDELGGGFDIEQSFNGTIDEVLFFGTTFDIDDVEDLYEYVLEPPRIIEKIPDGGRHTVDTVINITFNLRMNMISFPQAFIIVPDVNGSFVWNENKVSFIPDEDLKGDTEYKVTVTTDAMDHYGRNLEKNTEFKFKTEKIEEPDPGSDDDTDTDPDTDADVDDDPDDEESGIDRGVKAMMAIGLLIFGMVVIIGILAFLSRKKEDF